MLRLKHTNQSTVLYASRPLRSALARNTSLAESSGLLHHTLGLGLVCIALEHIFGICGIMYSSVLRMDAVVVGEHSVDTQ